MFKTIVLALDGSEGSKRAIPLATELAQRDDAKIVIAHIDERIVGKGGGDIHPAEAEVQAEIRKQAEALSEQGIDASVQMRDVMVGGPARPIAEIAEEAGADLIVAGTRGHSGIPGVLLGSVTHRLLHLANRPVLVVPPPA
ncbi:MAG: UspA domain protein [Solirubrobacterales bacterium]|jgi:nucleotide-binding universal stress UspA family protein|nr:UspA domain protein [Solirubrobacterales bacterium]